MSTFAQWDDWSKGVPVGVTCPRCDLPRTREGHDPCIANLPGVTAACCGHGVDHGYVLFDNCVVIRGIFETPDSGFWPEFRRWLVSAIRNGLKREHKRRPRL